MNKGVKDWEIYIEKGWLGVCWKMVCAINVPWKLGFEKVEGN